MYLDTNHNTTSQYTSNTLTMVYLIYAYLLYKPTKGTWCRGGGRAKDPFTQSPVEIAGPETQAACSAPSPSPSSFLAVFVAGLPAVSPLVSSFAFLSGQRYWFRHQCRCVWRDGFTGRPPQSKTQSLGRGWTRPGPACMHHILSARGPMMTE